MPISEVHVGRTYPPTPGYEVSRAKIAEFAAALGDGDNPAYAGDSPIAPPTFAAVLSSAAWGALFEDSELGLALHRTVHGDQRFTWARPLRAGDVITATLRIDGVRARGAMAIVSISVQLTTVEGEDVCTASSTLLHTAEAA